MADGTARSDRNGSARPPASGPLLDADLRHWAGEAIAEEGRREALLGRVEFLRLAPGGRAIESRVRGNRPLPYRVKVWLEDDRLVSRCTCARQGGPACKHAVATLEALRFPVSPLRRDAGVATRRRSAGPAGRGRGRVIRAADPRAGYLVVGGVERTLTREERVDAARDEARAQRRQRARRDRDTVKPIGGDGGPATFEVRRRGAGGGAKVTLRGDRGRLAVCDCADFAGNELQTCRHVERVRQWILRKKKPTAEGRLSVWWRPREWPEQVPDPLRELRIDAGDGPGEGFAPHFDAEGWLTAPPEGVRATDWARRAVDDVRRHAAVRGARFDLDPLVERRIAAVEREETLGRRLARIDPDRESWRSVIGRLRMTLHPYQETGALFLARRGRAMLADEMGLGKTVQAIVAALLLREEVGARRCLVVGPASLKYQWRREIDKACGESATVVEGPRSQRLAAYRAWRDGFLVVNYELVLRDLDAIRATSPDLVVLDEAQRIKNWDTKTARCVKRLDSPLAFILTGTPLENRLMELHSLIEFLHPRGLGPRWRLQPFHAVTEPQGRVIAFEGLEVLRRRLGGFFLRRDRAQVLDQLPDRTDNLYWTGMTPAQRRPYRRKASTIGALLSRNAPLTGGEVRTLLQALTAMRILCNAAAQYEWSAFAERVADPRPPSRAEIKALGSPKLEEFVRVLEDLLDDSEGKIVVYSQWERMLRLARYASRELLESRDLRAELFHGGLSARARDEMLEAFGSDPEFHVLFSTDAGGLGLNLQEAASIVVNLEVPWNPAVLDQRVGRVHRMGQRRSVQVLHFVTRGALEERVRQVVESKRALFRGLMSDDVDRVVLDDMGRSTLIDQVRQLVDPKESAED